MVKAEAEGHRNQNRHLDHKRMCFSSSVAGLWFFIMVTLGHPYQTLSRGLKNVGHIEVPPVSLVTMANSEWCPLCWACYQGFAYTTHPHQGPISQVGRLRLGSKNLAEVTLGISDLGQFTPGYLALRCTGRQPCRIPGSQPTAPPIVMCKPNTCVHQVAHGRAGRWRDAVQILWKYLRVPGVGGSQSLLMGRKLKGSQRLPARFAAWASLTSWPDSETPP